MKIRPLLNGLVNYIAAVGLSLVFALYLSGRVGWFLVAAFLCAPVISVLLTYAFAKRIYAEVEMDAAAVCKGESCEITVTVSNDLFLPSPPVIVEMFSCARAVCSDKSIAVSLMPYASESFDVKYTAAICGPCEIGCSDIVIKDFFGIMSFRVKSIDVNSLKTSLSIIPDIAEIKADDAVISDTAEMIALADDSEETTDNSSLRFGGFPGYESREYVPGDPLKRISWKQSVKRGKLLVRLDDEMSSPSISVILDSCFIMNRVNRAELFAVKNMEYCNDSNIVENVEQWAVESCLGLIRAFIISGYSVNFLMNGKSGWQIYPANDENELSVIQTELASYSFSQDENVSRFPSEQLQTMKGSVSVFCSPYADKGLIDELAPYSSKSGKEELKTTLYCAAGNGGRP